VRRPRSPYGLSLLFGVCRGAEFNHRLVDGSIQYKRKEFRYVVHPELFGYRKEGRGHESRNHVCARHVRVNYVFFLSRGAMWW